MREVCVFARHDLTRDPPFPRLDLVSCRNVLIYMGAALQRRVVPLLHYGLLPGGYLMLGHAESVGGRGELLEAVDATHRIFAKKAGPVPQIVPFAPAPPMLEERPGGLAEFSDSQTAAAGHGTDIAGQAERAVLADFVPPGVTVDSALKIVRFSGETAPFLCNPSGRPTRELLDMICPELLDELQAALTEARLTETKAVRSGLPPGEGKSTHEVNLHVVPFESQGSTNFVVLFEEVSRSKPGLDRPATCRQASAPQRDRAAAPRAPGHA